MHAVTKMRYLHFNTKKSTLLIAVLCVFLDPLSASASCTSEFRKGSSHYKNAQRYYSNTQRIEASINANASSGSPSREFLCRKTRELLDEVSKAQSSAGDAELEFSFAVFSCFTEGKRKDGRRAEENQEISSDLIRQAGGVHEHYKNLYDQFCE